ncbi:hypothetical protein [Acidiferrobacter sp.]|uniref:hypothetical protein n=1 Tax=Acidiferrobacter sp. TaxID=1872107 RepID=UPI0026091381|nr:hypothetical protein [Acidiferrobacter sp.]
MRKIIGVVGLLACTSAYASQVTISGMVGTADALDAYSQGSGLVWQIGAQCGCAVESTIATREPAGRLAIAFRLARGFAVQGSVFVAGTYHLQGLEYTATQTDYFAANDQLYGGAVEALIRGHRRGLFWHLGAGAAMTNDAESTTITNGTIAVMTNTSTTRIAPVVSGGFGFRMSRHWSVGISVSYITRIGSSETLTSGEYTNGGLLLTGVDGIYQF